MAAGNHKEDFSKSCNSYPSCYNIKSDYFWVVGGDGKYSNYNSPVNVIMPSTNICAFDICLSGTSQAAAQWSNHLLKLGIK